MGPHWRRRWARCHPSPAPHRPPHLSPCARLPSYGRVYAATDPYHHTIGPPATYSIGTMVRSRGLAVTRLGWAGPETVTQTSEQCLGRARPGLESGGGLAPSSPCPPGDFEGGRSRKDIWPLIYPLCPGF